MTIERFSELLEQVGTLTGIDDLKPDENGQCCLNFDDQFNVFCEYDFETEWVKMYTLAGYVGDGDRESVYASLLEANLYWGATRGATLGLDREELGVYLAEKQPVQLLTDESFQKWLENFLHTAKQIRALLYQLDESPAEDDDYLDDDESDDEGEIVNETQQAATDLASFQRNQGIIRP